MVEGGGEEHRAESGKKRRAGEGERTGRGKNDGTVAKGAWDADRKKGNRKWKGETTFQQGRERERENKIQTQYEDGHKIDCENEA